MTQTTLSPEQVKQTIEKLQASHKVTQDDLQVLLSDSLHKLAYEGNLALFKGILTNKSPYNSQKITGASYITACVRFIKGETSPDFVKAYQDKDTKKLADYLTDVDNLARLQTAIASGAIWEYEPEPETLSFDATLERALKTLITSAKKDGKTAGDLTKAITSHQLMTDFNG